MPHRYETFDWYEQPWYYDAVFDEGTAEEAAFLERVFDKHGQSRGRRALEPACGSGRLMIAMARRGFDVTGFDLAQGMIDLAKQRVADAGIDARLDRKSMSDFAYRRKFDLAWNLVSTFRHLQHESQARGHLRCMADALKVGGLYVLGLHLSDYLDTHQHHERWVAHRDGIEVVCNIRSWPADRRQRREPCRARIVATHPDGTVGRLETRWAFRTYSRPQLLDLLATEPRLEQVATYGFEHDPDRPIDLGRERLDAVLVLRRRG